MGDWPAMSVAKGIPSSVAKSLETVRAEADLDANNGDKKEEEKASDMSVPKTCTEPESK